MMLGHALILLGLLAGACAIAAVARQQDVAEPILLVLVGLGVSYIPGVPKFQIEPNVVMVFMITPLLYATALESSYLNLRDNIRSLSLLSVGLVIFTVVAVAWAARATISELPLAAALTLGAILAPTDAVTTISVGRRLGLPRRVLTVLSGESMFNDGTALTAYRVTVAAAGGATVSLLAASGQFVGISLGGAAIGLALGWVVRIVRDRLSDPLVESATSLLVPFAAYLIAELSEVSGVLAVLVAGIYLSHHSGEAHFATRIQDMVFWRLAVFVLESLVFALIGLQLRPILEQLSGQSAWSLAADAAVVLAVVVISRIAWVFPATYLPRWLLRRVRERDPAPRWQVTAVLSWAGMRGVISLAAAFALPDNFPQRDLIVFLTFCATGGTLLLQGTTLPVLIRRLGVGNAVAEAHADAIDEAEALQAASAAGLRRLAELAEAASASGEELPADVIERLRRLAERRQTAACDLLGDGTEESSTAAFSRLRREMTAAERDVFIRLRDERRIDDEVLDRVLRGLDLEEAMLSRDEWASG
jgi:CPA1 family monovalent cation:H+ antiporter